MKIQKLLPYLLIIASSASIFAAPSEINYQGVLTDQQGNPVNGVRAMQIKIYDAPTGGTLLYSEDLGNVPVQDGIYSFAFGANGTSNALTTEAVAIANGTVSTFQKVLVAPTVVAGSVTVTDGTYTWDQTNGSSNENDFSVAYSPNLRRVTVTYYNGAPAAGKTISAKFRAPGSGITGALAEDNQPWIEVSLAGVAQNPRQKVLTVPYAAIAGSVNIDSIAYASKTVEIPIRRFAKVNFPAPWQSDFGLPNSSLPLSYAYAQLLIPEYVRYIKSIKITYRTISSGSVNISIPGSNWLGITWKGQSSFKTEVVPVNIEIPIASNYCLSFSALPQHDPFGNASPGTGAEITELIIIADVAAIAGPF